MSAYKNQLLKAMCALSLGIASVGAVHAATADLIKEKECEACHGTNGVSTNTDIPTIAGIPAYNLSDQMMRYLDGRPAKTVNHVQGDTSKSGDMATVVESLSEEQIEELAAYYSEMDFVRADQPFDEALAKKGKAIHDKSCDSCHAEGGSDPFDEASILAGQHKGYLLTSLMQFNKGERSADKKMDKAIKELSEDDLKALAEYYASYQ
ncbi:c-type cytochrome [Vibrio sp.]|uniref:c-type cytochrome n=1 Tax=Vibrio sp. TaxID=678 RepID=UPI003D096ED1